MWHLESVFRLSQYKAQVQNITMPYINPDYQDILLQSTLYIPILFILWMFAFLYIQHYHNTLLHSRLAQRTALVRNNTAFCFIQIFNKKILQSRLSWNTASVQTLTTDCSIPDYNNIYTWKLTQAPQAQSWNFFRAGVNCWLWTYNVLLQISFFVVVILPSY